MKQTTILTAQTLGYFRAKSDEKKQGIFDDLMLLEDFQDSQSEDIKGILNAEVMRRHQAYEAKAKKALIKVEQDAAKPLTGGVESATAHITQYPAGNYIVTVAQNNTDVDKVFLGALENFALNNNATILVAKMTYNKNAFCVPLDATEGIYYDPAITKYLINGQIALGHNIHVIGQANVNPTAKHPLSSFESITPNGIHVIIPASKIALKCTAALKGTVGKNIFSTGAVTKRNYIIRKAGSIANASHNIGALYVVVADDGTVTVRQLELMPGELGFYDECMYYTSDAITYNESPACYHFGDIHAEKLSNDMLERLVQEVNNYEPTSIVLHDVSDWSSRNHHNTDDPFFMFKQTIAARTVQNDVDRVREVIMALSLFGYETAYRPDVHIITSNHDLALDRWLKETTHHEDPINALFYLRCSLAMYEHIASGSKEPFNLLEFACGHLPGYVKFNGVDQSLIIAGCEMGQHGHIGSNGARGSPVGYMSLGVKMNTGHTHSPAINGGVYTAGCCELDMGYNEGASSWRLANVIVWPNGQRQVKFM